jgi:hypothetical protein
MIVNAWVPMKGARNWPFSLVSFLGTFLIIREKPSWLAASSNWNRRQEIIPCVR